MAKGPGDPATRWSCPSGRGLRADLHNKDEAVLKVAQRALLSEYSPFDAHFPARSSHHTDRLLWVSLYRFWRHWRSTLLIVKPETAVAWHRKGVRLLELESQARTRRTAGDLSPDSRPDPQDVLREPHLGCTSHSWGVAQARHRHRRK